MAMLVEDGYRAAEQRAMHPFFRQAQHQPKCGVDRSQSNDTAIVASDGADEKGDIPAHDFGEPSETVARWNEVSVNDNSEIDPNYERRKRRKFSPASEPTPSSGSKAQDVSGGKDAWLRQLEGAASEAGTDKTNAAATNTTLLSNSEVNDLAESDDGTKQSEDPVPQTPPANITSTATPEVGQPNSQQTLSKMSKRSGGSLSATPKRSKNTDSADKPSPRRSARQSRNLTFKNGRLVSSLKLSFPYKSVSKEPATFGEKIEAILKAKAIPRSDGSYKEPAVVHPAARAERSMAPKSANPSKTVHPFFLGKAASKSQISLDEPANATKEESESTGNAPASTSLKSWNDLGFSASRQSRAKTIGCASAPWPPRGIHHIGVDEPTVDATAKYDAECISKQKRETIRMSDNESILEVFGLQLRSSLTVGPQLRLPQQWRTNGSEVLAKIRSQWGSVEPASGVVAVQERIRNGQSAFDRGLPAGPLDWAHEYAPKKACNVLQVQSTVFRDWLQKLKVHHVQSKLSATSSRKRRAPKKKRVRKHIDDLDDFLVSSDDEPEDQAPVKNAIIICGPSGCGKTASVYAAAQELDFEVFEIHPGMRRTARDIFDKVGDMTHNHLVQTGASAPLSRASSVLSDTPDTVADAQLPDSKQKSLAAFVGIKGALSSVTAQARPLDERKETQKQSLILFEEVDVQFDEDKTFWSGVQSLIATSKRPIVLTCNSLEDIPLEDIDVAMVLHYERPGVQQVVELLHHVAAAEGHLLEPEALRTLYLSRGQDLRAAFAELDFWCQMTIGSTLGGLDWMLHERRHESDKQTSPSQRIMSNGTFYNGLHLVPEVQLDDQALLSFAQDSLSLSVLAWEDDRNLDHGTDSRPRFEQLKQMELIADTKSCMDILDLSLAPLLSYAISNLHSSLQRPVTREMVSRYLLKESTVSLASIDTISDAFEAVKEDNRTFPPPTGRTAPSLDCGLRSIATDVAPYIRHIVQLDQQIELQRSEIDASSQGTGRQRRTRAARAALEGGSVAGTRVARWFPKDLDFEAVLSTGGQWAIEESMRPLSRQSTDVTMSTQESVF